MVKTNAIPKVKAVTPLQKYRLFIEYNDGVSGEVDLAYLSGKGVFEWWEKDDNFSKVHVDSTGTITWNEDVDIDALNCYLKITKQTFEEYARS